jgi:hypothetical protein
MGRSPRTVKLVEAFRVILRAIYPGRPALADEIESYDWLYFDPNRRSIDPEIWAYVGGEEFWRGEERAGKGREDEDKAFKEAHRRLEDSVRQEHGKFRLRGAPHPSSPLEDIDPAYARDGKLDVFAGKLHVFDGNKIIKTYHRVDCYETDVNRCVAELCSETKDAKRTSEADFEEFKQNFLTSEAPQTEAAITQAAINANINRPRDDLRKALPPNRPRGPRPKSPKK